VEEVVVIEFDIGRLFGSTIDNTGDLTGVAQAAARTRALQFACICDDFHDNLQMNCPRPGRSLLNQNPRALHMGFDRCDTATCRATRRAGMTRG
jgi:hypothetical protein